MGKWISMHPEEISDFLKLESKDISSYAMVKAVNFKDDSKQLCPQMMTSSDFLNWYIMPSTHQAYAYFWLSLSGLILFSNLFIWINLLT